VPELYSQDEERILANACQHQCRVCWRLPEPQVQEIHPPRFIPLPLKHLISPYQLHPSSRKEQLKEDGLHHATECLRFPGASHSSLRESLPQQYYHTLYVRPHNTRISLTKTELLPEPTHYGYFWHSSKPNSQQDGCDIPITEVW
jgi:hypothetical protein